MTAGFNRRRRVGAALALLLAWMAMPGGAAKAASSPQIGDKLGSILKKAQQASEDLKIDDQEEQALGADVSARIRERYGVVQDPAVTRYVSLVGTVLAQASSRPNLAWKFIVLDTDGVNAFAAPGGYIHITRGALGLIQTEAELAGVLAHELTHVTAKHTIRAVQKNKLVQVGANQSKITRDSPIFKELVAKSTEIVMAGFGRDDELEADQKGVRLANAVGYAPSALVDFLGRLADRNRSSASKQGLFASHPEMQDRIQRLRNQVSAEHLVSTATLGDRYHRFISYTAVDQTSIATVEAGAAGLTGSSGNTSGTTKSGSSTSGGTTKSDGTKKDQPPPKKKGFGLGSLLAPGPSEKKSAEVTGSAAARGVDKELGAKGGPVKTVVPVTLTAADIAAFKKEGNLR